MKKIIKNRRYDTGTAKAVARWDNGLYGDFAECAETLYRKANGEYFLHGEGGPRSKYAKTENRLVVWGERIMPLAYDEAREWAEERLDGDKYEEIFGSVEEGDGKISVNLRLSSAAFEKLKRAAAREGLPLSAVAEARIQQLPD